VTVVLTGSDLSIAEVVRVARERDAVALDRGAAERMMRTRAVVERAVERGDPVYGLTTGVGADARRALDPRGDATGGLALIAAHRVGQGEPASPEVVRATVLVLANGFAGGWAGVRPALAERLLAALNEDRLPPVRSLGSVGEADLAPLADLALGVLGEFELGPGEALALLSSNAFSTGCAALAVRDAEALGDAVSVAGALSLEGFAANLSVLSPEVAESRRSDGLRVALERVRALLEGSRLWEPGVWRNPQDPLTFRTIAHVQGALADELAFAKRQVAVELNAHQGNPLVLESGDRLITVSNFEALPLAAAMDVTRIALAPAISSSCERTVKLLDAPWSGLPRGLVEGDGDGLAFLGISTQAIAAEARLLAQPVSFETVSTAHAEGIEDRASMAPLAARRTAEMVHLGQRVVAVELICAAQAAELRGAASLGRGTAEAFRLLRDRISYVQAGDPPPDAEPAVKLVSSGALDVRSLTGGT